MVERIAHTRVFLGGFRTSAPLLPVRQSAEPELVIRQTRRVCSDGGKSDESQNHGQCVWAPLSECRAGEQDVLRRLARARDGSDGPAHREGDTVS